jgi:hypothetical protein
MSDSDDKDLPERPERSERPESDKSAAPLDDEQSLSGTIGESLASAAKRTGLGQVAEGEPPTGRALLAAMGGIRGLAETVLPGLIFLVVYTITFNVPLSLGGAVLVAVIFTVIRVATKGSTVQAVAGLIGVGASAILALITGRGSDFFLLGILLNAGYGIALLISMLVRWPLIGLAAGYLMDNGIAWRSDRAKYRSMWFVTLFWVLLFAVRLAVELPLFIANDITALAFTKLLLGVPLYAPLVLVSWLVVRAVFAKPQASASE